MADYKLRIIKDPKEIDELKKDKSWIEPSIAPQVVASQSYWDVKNPEFLKAFLAEVTLERVEEVALLPIERSGVVCVVEKEIAEPQYHKGRGPARFAGNKIHKELEKIPCDRYRFLVKLR